MHNLGCQHNIRLRTVHYMYRTEQGVLITSLCSLSGLSERVRYSLKLQNTGFGPHCRQTIFLFSEMFRQSLGPPSLLFKGYGDSSLGMKWPKLGMSGAVPLLHQYAFMACIRQLYFIQDSTVEGCNKPCL